MKIDTLNAIYCLGEERNFYPSSSHLFSNLGAIRYYSSAHSDAEHLWASRKPTQGCPSLHYATKNALLKYAYQVTQYTVWNVVK